jgi:hypothetical protein
MNIIDANPFLSLWRRGFHTLLPIRPREKIPGRLTPHGWTGFDGWQHYQATETDLVLWRSWGAGVGIRCDNGLLAIDVDTLDARLADLIGNEIRKHLGALPTRIGQAPKAIYFCRTDPDYRHPNIPFDGGVVEVRTYGQFVADGIHKETGAPYFWPVPLGSMNDLPYTTPAVLDSLWAVLRSILLQAETAARIARGPVDQATLPGDPVLVTRAVTATPNDYADRAIYIQVACAIKGALPNDPELAWDLFWSWCRKWEPATRDGNDEDTARKDWESLRPPFNLGSDYLYRLAARRAPQSFTMAEVWFEEPILMENLFDSAAAPLIAATPFDFTAARAVGPRESLYGGHYIRQFVSSTIAPSKVGKSSLIIAEALAMASGKPLLGVPPAGPLRVWLWNGEDPFEELQRRIVACMQLYGLVPEDVGDRLFVDSGRKMPIVLATQTRGGAVINAPVEAGVISTIQENLIDVFQVDPFISSHRVSENDNNAIDVVTKRWGFCADVTRAAIEIPHHSRKLNGAEVSVEDGRGASALLATVRSSRALARMTTQEAERLGLREFSRRLFRFTEVSSNLSIPAPESQQWLELASVNLANGRGDEMDKVVKGDSVGVVRVFDMTAGKNESLVSAQIDDQSGIEGQSREDRALAAVRAHTWRASDKCEDWAGVPIAQALGIDHRSKEGRAQLRNIISAWLKQGKLVEENHLTKARQLKIFIVAPVKKTVANSLW